MVHEMGRDEAERIIGGIFMGVLRRPADKAGLDHFAEALMRGETVSSILKTFIDCEEFQQQTSVKLFAPPGHFYSPIVPLAEAERHLAFLGQSVPHALPEISIDHPAMVAHWYKMISFIEEFPFPNTVMPPFRYAVQNQNFGFGDSAVLYAMLRLRRPKRLVEIGSGWSSACSLDTVERHLGGACSVTFIEPYPQLLREIIGDLAAKVEIIEGPVQLAPIAIFERLEAGDILFIDSTHVLRTGSDVCFELFEIIPRIKAGVIVHFHDMFWPFEYPAAWVLQDNRSWNELYAVRAFLMGNADWKILYFNDYFAKTEPELVKHTCPRILQNSGGGLWLERVTSPA